MDSFSLLKYWRASSARADVASTSTTTIATSATTEPNNGGEEEEDGSFFDLEFSSAATTNENSNSIFSESNGEDDDKGDHNEEDDKGDHNEEEEKEISFTVSSSSPSSDQSTSPLDDLFFKGTLLPDLETSSIVLSNSSDSDTKAVFPISFLKSATKFRVFTKKPKSDTDTDTAVDSPKKSNLFIRLINVEEVPIVSLFSGSRNSSNKNKPDQQVDQDNKFLVHKYIDKIKPLYVRVSRKYGDKLGFSGQLTAENTDSSGGGDRTARVATGFRVVMKRLGKSKSSSSAVAAVTSPPPVIARKMDEEDGIQSAIAHCKRSFNSSTKETQSQRSEDGGEIIT